MLWCLLTLGLFICAFIHGWMLGYLIQLLVAQIYRLLVVSWFTCQILFRSLPFLHGQVVHFDMLNASIVTMMIYKLPWWSFICCYHMEFMFSLYAFEIQGKKKSKGKKRTCSLDDSLEQWQYYYILWVKKSFVLRTRIH